MSAMKSGDYRKAAALFDKFAAIQRTDPRRSMNLYHQAWCQARSGRDRDALNTLSELRGLGSVTTRSEHGN